ncbi:Ribonuclease 3 [Methanimicrococcus sp. At1]|uniref:Ribonuclease 3 n=1 Tax=Methanimicrococcus hacksteinii TaxID=3028293 RepID=A0ABU3VRD2_9EURY|nr:putative dsRNA-binding protein [Methanimicrococcus sp. At1]MDV0445958.1 Ribonuclease 3 [Methanimicrococcus sp. At1]
MSRKESKGIQNILRKFSAKISAKLTKNKKMNREGIEKKEEISRKGIEKKEEISREGIEKKEEISREGIEKKEEISRKGIEKKEDEKSQTGTIDKLLQNESQEELYELEAEIGYDFNSILLLQKTRIWATNKKTAFFGDTILGYVVTEFLFKTYPDFDQGQLTIMRAHIISDKNLEKIVKENEWDRYLVTEVSIPSKSRKLTSTFLEAIIGAIYLDGGILPAEIFVCKYIVNRKEIEKAMEILHISEAKKKKYKKKNNCVALNCAALNCMILNDMSQSPKEKLNRFCKEYYDFRPQPFLIAEEGPPHDRTFIVEYRLSKENTGLKEDIIGTGKGKRKSDAEKEAAKQINDYLIQINTTDADNEKKTELKKMKNHKQLFMTSKSLLYQFCQEHYNKFQPDFYIIGEEKTQNEKIYTIGCLLPKKVTGFERDILGIGEGRSKSIAENRAAKQVNIILMQIGAMEDNRRRNELLRREYYPKAKLNAFCRTHFNGYMPKPYLVLERGMMQGKFTIGYTLPKEITGLKTDISFKETARLKIEAERKAAEKVNQYLTEIGLMESFEKELADSADI